MPAAWGGPELPIGDMLLVIEELAYADGAAGWCTMIGCDSGFYAAKLEDAVAREVLDDLDLVTAGADRAGRAGHAARATAGASPAAGRSAAAAPTPTGSWAVPSSTTPTATRIIDATHARLAHLRAPDRRGDHPRHLGPDGPRRHRQPRLLGGRRRGCPTSTACSRSSRPCGMARSTRSRGRSSSRAPPSRSGWPAERSTSSWPSRPASWCSPSSRSSATSTTSTTAWRAAAR